MIFHDKSWHIMIYHNIWHFCHTNQKIIFVAKTGNYGVFVSKIYDYVLINSFWGSAGFLDSAASYAGLGVKESNFAAKNASPFSYLLRVRAEGVQSLLCWSWKIAVGRNKSTQASVLLCLFCHLSVLEGFGGQSQSYMSRAGTTFLRLHGGTVSS